MTAPTACIPEPPRGHGRGARGAICAGPGAAALAVSVIAMAWEDGLVPAAEVSPYFSPHRPQAGQQREARAFLTDREGQWAEARALWCQFAGVCADALREAAERWIAAHG